MSITEKWFCSCGRENTGKFCANCGKKKVVGTTKSALEGSEDQSGWICECGKKNTKNFCANCGCNKQTALAKKIFSGSKKIDKRLCIFVAIVLCIGGLFLAWLIYLNAQPMPEPATSAIKTQTTKPIREISSDLSLGGIVIGDTIGKVHEILGSENKREVRAGGYVFYMFQGLQVGAKDDNVITALVSDGKNVTTKRGIHEGSTYGQMVDAYGKDYEKTDYNDLVLYEYSFTGVNGKKGLLRFAVNKTDETINYISVRIPDEDAEKSNDGGKAALQAFQEYHGAISQKNLRSAYDYYEAAYKSRLSYDGWAAGYKNTISSNINRPKIVYADSDQCKISYTLLARDRNGTSVKVQTFNGMVVMVKENGRWLIKDIQADKIRETYE